jgi:hypothetical protein
MIREHIHFHLISYIVARVVDMHLNTEKYKFHIIFTVYSVLYNSFYFNQHMHYTFVVIYTPTYVSTTY